MKLTQADNPTNILTIVKNVYDKKAKKTLKKLRYFFLIWYYLYRM